VAIPLAANDFLQVTINCKAGAQYSSNVMNYVVGAVAGTSATDAQAATQLDAFLAPLFKDLLPTTVTYWGLKAQIIGPTRRPGQYSVAAQGVGNVAGDIIPTQVSGLLTMRTQFTGPKHRGRMYVPFPGEADNTASGAPSAGYITRLDALRAGMIAGLILINGVGNTATILPVVYSRLDEAAFEITESASSPFWATQKRRAERMRGDGPPG